MPKPVEFSKFYNLLFSIRKGERSATKELEKILSEYEKREGSESGFEEVGKIFCCIGLEEIYNYVGLNDLKYISELERNVWDYLKKREGQSLPEFLASKMVSRFKNSGLIDDICSKWECKEKDISENLVGLARYVTEGLIEVID